MKHPPATGTLSARIHGAESVMRHRGYTALAAARQLDPDSPAAAALRGKANAYREAADLLRRLDAGGNIPSRTKDYERLLAQQVALSESLGATASQPAFQIRGQ